MGKKGGHVAGRGGAAKKHGGQQYTKGRKGQAEKALEASEKKRNPKPPAESYMMLADERTPADADAADVDGAAAAVDNMSLEEALEARLGEVELMRAMYEQELTFADAADPFHFSLALDVEGVEVQLLASLPVVGYPHR